MQLARGLGWFSIGLGLAEVLASRSLARFIGVRYHPVLFRMFGLREIITGVAILSERRPAAGIQARVAGDVLDLAALGAALSSKEAHKGRVALATGAVAGVTALDVYCSRKLSTRDRAVHVERSVVINRPAEELYNFWRNFENLPRFMSHLESVKVTGDRRSHLVSKTPMGLSIEWEAEITQDEPNHLIAWRSADGADVSGMVIFERAPGKRGTAVRATLDFLRPAGALGAKIAALFGKVPEMHIESNLRRFKQLMETGEIPTTVGQPAGRPTSTSRRFDLFIPK